MTDIILNIRVSENGQVLTGVATNLDRVAASSDRASSSTKGFDSVLQGIAQGVGMRVFDVLSSSVSSFVTSLPAAVAQLGAVSEEMLNLSAVTGEVYDELQGLALAGDIVGIPLDSITASIGKMQKALAEGSKDTIAALRGIGLSAGELKNMGAAEALDLILSHIQQIPDPAERTAAAMALLGKSGAALLPLAGQLGGMADKAKELGAISEETARRAAALDDQLGFLQKAWANLFAQIAGGVATSNVLATLINEITNLLGRMAVYVRDNQKELRNLVDSGIILLVQGLVAMANGVSLASAGWAGLLLAWNSVIIGATLVAEAMVRLRIAMLQAVTGGAMLFRAEISVLNKELVALQGTRDKAAAAMNTALANDRKYADQISVVQSALEKLQQKLETAAGAINKTSDAADKGGGKYRYLGDAAAKAAEDIVKAARALAEFNAQQDKLLEDRMRSGAGDLTNLLNPTRAGLFSTGPGADSNIGGGGLTEAALERWRAMERIQEMLHPAQEKFDQLTLKTAGDLLREGIIGQEAFDKIKKSIDDAHTSTEAWREALAGAGQTLGMLSSAVARMGDERLAQGLSGAANIAQGVASGNPAAIFSGAFDLAEALIGGSTAEERAAERMLEQGRVLGGILGHAITESAQQAMNDDAARLGISVNLAALLHISDSGGDASTFGGPILGALLAIQTGALPAAEGIAAVNDAFVEMAASADAGNEQARRGVEAVIAWTEQTHTRIAAVMDYVRERAETSTDALTVLFEGVVEGSEGAADSIALFAGEAIFNFNRMRAQGFSLAQIFAAIGPSIDAAIEALDRLGIAVPAALSEIKFLRDWVVINPELVAGVDAFHTVMQQIIQDGRLTQESLGQAEAGLKGLVDRLIASDLPMPEILRILGPTLRMIHDGAGRAGLTLDTFTQELYDAADAAGTLGSTDPMADMASSMRDLVGIMGSLAQHFGITLPAAILESIRLWTDFNRVAGGAPPRPGAPAGPPGSLPPPPVGNPLHATPLATGGYIPSMPVGPFAGGMSLIGAHPGEEVLVRTPAQQQPPPFSSNGPGGGNVYVSLYGAWHRNPREIADEVQLVVQGNVKGSNGQGTREVVLEGAQ